MPNLNANRTIQIIYGKALPPGGWTARTFGTDGHALLVSLSRVAKITQRRAVRGMALTVRDFMRSQVKAVVRVVERQKSMDTKATLEFSPPQHQALWMHAIDAALKEANAGAVLDLMPPIQSVMGQGYSKTGILLGQPADASVNGNITRRARDTAQRITGINDVTRELMERIVLGSIKDGQTVEELTATFVSKMDASIQGRALTIARTELNDAWSQGSIQAFKESKTLTHISVIGCESREESRWKQPSFQPYLYKGEGTCNIQDVPIQDIEQLKFHPNHTGTIVPSKFREG